MKMSEGGGKNDVRQNYSAVAREGCSILGISRLRHTIYAPTPFGECETPRTEASGTWALKTRER